VHLTINSNDFPAISNQIFIPHSSFLCDLNMMAFRVVTFAAVAGLVEGTEAAMDIAEGAMDFAEAATMEYNSALAELNATSQCSLDYCRDNCSGSGHGCGSRPVHCCGGMHCKVENPRYERGIQRSPGHCVKNEEEEVPVAPVPPPPRPAPAPPPPRPAPVPASWAQRALVADEGNNLKSLSSVTLDNCKAECKADTACHSFSFSPSKRRCHLKDKCVTASDATDHNPGHVGYVTHYKPCKQDEVLV